jgi:hypothetical protein
MIKKLCAMDFIFSFFMYIFFKLIKKISNIMLLIIFLNTINIFITPIWLGLTRNPTVWVWLKNNCYIV